MDIRVIILISSSPCDPIFWRSRFQHRNAIIIPWLNLGIRYFLFLMTWDIVINKIYFFVTYKTQDKNFDFVHNHNLHCQLVLICFGQTYNALKPTMVVHLIKVFSLYFIYFKCFNVSMLNVNFINHENSSTPELRTNLKKIN